MNLLTLEQWRQIIQYNPFHFWGLAGSLAPVTSACNSVVKEYNWQDSQAVGREAVRQAIEAAEKRLVNYLGFSPAPNFVTEIQPWPRYHNQQLERRGYAAADARWLTIRANQGKVIKAGVEARDLIEAGVTITLSDEDGDGLKESFTCSFAVTFTDPDQVELQFTSADLPFGSSAGERWKISPLKVSISGGTATVKGPSWLLVSPKSYQAVTYTYQDAGSDSSYVSTVDAWRVYCNPEGTDIDTCQAKLIWESRPWPWWSFATPNTSTDPAAEAYAIARVGIRDAELGILDVGQAVYDTTSGTWASIDWRTYRPPDRIEIRYQAGQPLVNGLVESRMGRLVAILASAELSERICACDAANRELYRWQFDLARTSGNADESYGAMSAEDLNNPWGTRRGQVYAFKELKGARILRGFAP